MPNKYNVILLILTATITPSVLAQPYSWQLAVDRHETHPTDSKQSSLAGEYYFAPVATNTGPLQQAAFSQRASSIGLAYSDADIRPSVNTDSYRLFGQYILKDSGWFTAASYVDLSGSGKTNDNFVSTRSDTDGKDYSVSVGKYLLANTSLALSYQSQEIEESITATVDFTLLMGGCGLLPCTSTISSNTDTENDSYTISLKHLSHIEDIYYLLTASYTDTDRTSRTVFTTVFSAPVFLPGPMFNPVGLVPINPIPGLGFSDTSTLPTPADISSKDKVSSYSLGLTVYPARSLAVGVNYFARDDGISQPETYTLSIEWFVMPSLALNFSYGETDYENQTRFVSLAGQQVPVIISTPGTENYSLGISARF